MCDFTNVYYFLRKEIVIAQKHSLKIQCKKKEKSAYARSVKQIQKQTKTTKKKRLTYQKQDVLIAEVASAENTPFTKSLNTRLVRPLFMLKENVVTTLSKRVLVVKPSQFSERRPRQPRRSFFVLNALNANTKCNSHSRDASTLNWVETRKRR